MLLMPCSEQHLGNAEARLGRQIRRDDRLVTAAAHSRPASSSRRRSGTTPTTPGFQLTPARTSSSSPPGSSSSTFANLTLIPSATSAHAPCRMASRSCERNACRPNSASAFCCLRSRSALEFSWSRIVSQPVRGRAFRARQRALPLLRSGSQKGRALLLTRQPLIACPDRVPGSRAAAACRARRGRRGSIDARGRHGRRHGRRRAFPAWWPRESRAGDRMMRVTWMGHGSFRIEIAGQVLLLDPWITGNPSFRTSGPPRRWTARRRCC